MTVIVGYVDKFNNKVVLGADTCIGYGDFTYDHVKDKIQVVEEMSMLIGYTGSWRLVNEIRYKVNIPPYEEGSDITSYLITQLIPAIKEQVEDQVDESEFGMLIGFRGRLFEIDERFCLTESYRPYYATGTGGRHASGCLYALEGVEMSVKDKVTKALECATEFVLNVQRPFTIHEVNIAS